MEEGSRTYGVYVGLDVRKKHDRDGRPSLIPRKAGERFKTDRRHALGLALRQEAEGLMTLRGVSLISAMTVLAELGDISCFDSPRQLMAYLELGGADWL